MIKTGWVFKNDKFEIIGFIKNKKYKTKNKDMEDVIYKIFCKKWGYHTDTKYFIENYYDITPNKVLREKVLAYLLNEMEEN